MDGLLLFNKPSGCTSHDILIEIRKILNIQKVGHFGTLDPLANGLLLIGIGKATRLFPFFSKTDKLYKGQITLGFSTDTYDSFGKPISPRVKEWPGKNKIIKEMKNFSGEIEQIPPPFSAKKYKGTPLYKLARSKKEFPLKPCRIFIHYFRLQKFYPPFLDFEVKCSSGTYIRSIAQDLGQILCCGAHLSELTRIESGSYKLSDASSLEEIKEWTKQKKIDSFLIPLEFLLSDFPKIILDNSDSFLVRNGNTIFSENIKEILYKESKKPFTSESFELIFRLFDHEGKLIALAKKKEENGLHPFLVFN